MGNDSKMKWIKAIIAWVGIVVSGMYGGQKNKAVRRFGIPAICLLIGWPIGLLLVLPLSMGYGVDSVLGAWLGHIEWLIRLVYALLLSLPFAFFGLRRWVFASILLVIAFQIQAGSLGRISFFGDILVEDVIRYGILGLLIVWNVLFNKTRRVE
jgi:hypothetical protein